MHQPEKTEKKVEYLELIYDPIFVFVIGRVSLPYAFGKIVLR